jgi:hypothetical protein
MDLALKEWFHIHPNAPKTQILFAKDLAEWSRMVIYVRELETPQRLRALQDPS